MNIFIVSKGADSAGLWHLMKAEGHNVFAYIKEPWARPVAEGMIEKVDSVEAGVRKNPAYILFDMSDMGDLADALRKAGHKVIGASALSDKMEHNRAYGINVAKQFGIPVPETTEFNSVDEAINHVKKTKGTFAIKIEGSDANEASSYVAKSAEDMIDYLSYSKEEGKINGDKFILQVVVSGAEVSTECWYSNGRPLVSTVNSTWETKKFLAGELGQRTGAETSLVCHYDGGSMLYDRTVKKIQPLLEAEKWTGPVDANVIVDEKTHKCYFLEWSKRLGYSAIYAYCNMLGIGIGEFFRRIAFGENVTYKATWSSSLKLSIPPYPCDIPDKKANKETYGLSQGMVIKGLPNKDFWVIDAMKRKERIVTAGTSGIVGECMGRGKSVYEAWRASQKVFKDISLPNQQGRYTDGVEDAWKRIVKLRSWGFTDIPSPSNNSLATASQPLTKAVAGK